jgi:DNA modification methylase
MTAHPSPMLDNVTQGDCVEVMKDMPGGSVDLILTDPPYLVGYHDRRNRQVKNDDNREWLEPAFAEMYRVLKYGGACLSFYGWKDVDAFMAAWKKAGFRIVGHIVFPKQYASAKGFVESRHEEAYLLLKGNAERPRNPPSDVIPWLYTGNRLHPTQKPVAIFNPFIEAFTRPGDTVLDPLCGSGSALVAARDLGRHYIGIELDEAHHGTAYWRLKADREDRYGKPVVLSAGFNHHAPGASHDGHDFQPAQRTAKCSFRRAPEAQQSPTAR